MTSDLRAVFNPHQEARFRALTGVGDGPLDACFDGWNKYVLFAADRVFLIPRHQANVEWFEREIGVYAAVRAAVVPRLLGRWDDSAVWPYPFAAVTRLSGAPAGRVSVGLAAALGEAIAGWHRLDPPTELVGGRLPAHPAQPHHAWLRAALATPTSADAARDAAEQLGLPAGSLTAMLESAARLGHVLVHGDIHEDQLLVEGECITGVVDWETARVDHPFWDFDLSEWGTGLWRHQRTAFGELWQAMWSSYAAARSLDPDPRPLGVAFRVRHALYLMSGPDHDPAVSGTVEEQLDLLSDLLSP